MLPVTPVTVTVSLFDGLPMSTTSPVEKPSGSAIAICSAPIAADWKAVVASGDGLTASTGTTVQ